MKKTILIIDDEPAILSTLSGILKDEGYNVFVAATGEEARKSVSLMVPDLVFLDVWMPGMDGIKTLEELMAIHPELSVIVMSGHGSIETAVRAIKRGAYDFVEKPLSLEKVVRMVQHVFTEQRLAKENQMLHQQILKRHEMIGNCPAMQQLREQIKKAGRGQSRILISGENGTGKELVARAIHAASVRHGGPFVDVNCAAIPENLIESELFGYEKGAFTGADRQKAGRFECADGGTLFLDEIGDMAQATQAKLLRVLQEKSFHRVGGSGTPVTVDVRVIAASNKNLEEEIRKGTFREDLFYRLNVIPLHVPPLRERKEDISLLAEHFIREISQEQGVRPKEISPEALSLLERYCWPGNVRELRNILERCMILSHGPVLTPNDIPVYIGQAAVMAPDSLKEARSQFEREYILNKLQLHRWNIVETAEDLKIERTHLYRKMKSLRIEPP